MKKIIASINIPAVYTSKILLLLAVIAAINVQGLMAQEREHQGHQQGNNNRGQSSHQQGSNGNRPPVITQPVQRGDRGTHGNTQSRPQVNTGTSRPVPTQPVSRPNPVQHANRPNVVVNNNRTTVNVVNNGNRRYNPRPVYNAKNPSWHYANVPRRNSVITVVPSGYNTIHYGSYDYRYHNGVFYRPYNNTFMVVAPPLGLHISILPIGYRRIYVHNLPYYYYNGTYYDYRDNNYLVVSPPVGAVVESLPAGYETLTIDGETYYTVDGAQYKPVVQSNGEVWYEVVKAN